MSKRIFSLILAAVMVFSLLPVFASAEDEDPQQVAAEKDNLTPGEQWNDDRSLYVNKYLKEHSGDPNTFDLTLEAYSTGSTLTQELTTDVPLDIVLVLDQSGSMLDEDLVGDSGYVASSRTAWTAKQAVGWFYKDEQNYYHELKAENGAYYTYIKRPYLSDTILGTPNGESLHTSWKTYSTGYSINDNGTLRPVYSRTIGYLGGYTAQFFYYDGNGAQHFLTFNNGSSTSATYARTSLSLGMGSMKANANRLDAELFMPSTREGCSKLYWLDEGAEDVEANRHYVGKEAQYESDIVYNGPLYYLAESSASRLSALKDAAGQFVQTVADRATETGVDHRVAVVGFAGNAQSYSYCDFSKETGLTDFEINGNVNNWNYTNTGFFVNGNFINYKTPDFNNLQNKYNSNQGSSLYHNGVYFIHASHTRGQSGAFHPNEYIPMIYYDGTNIPDGFSGLIHDSGAGWYCPTFTNETAYQYSGWYKLMQKTLSNTTVYSFGPSVSFEHGVSGIYNNVYYGASSAPNYNNGEGYDFITTDLYYYEPSFNGHSPEEYAAALENITANPGENNVNDHVETALEKVNAFGGTYTSYGISMANHIFDATNGEGRKRIVVVFTDGQPGATRFDDGVAGESLIDVGVSKDKYGASVYTIGLFPSGSTMNTDKNQQFLQQLSSAYFTSDSEVYASGMEGDETYFCYDANDLKTYSVTSDNTLCPWCFVEDNGRYVRYLWSSDATLYRLQGSHYIRVTKPERGSSYYLRDSVDNRWYQVTYDYAWYDSNNNAICPKTNANDSREYAKQMYSISAPEPKDTGDFYYNVSDAASLVNAFQSITESIQTPTTTVAVDSASSVVRDVFSDDFVKTNSTSVTLQVVPCTMGINGEVSPSGDEDDPINANMTLTHEWKTEDGKTVLDVNGFDFGKYFISNGHPGYKLKITISGVKLKNQDQKGLIFSNEGTSGIYKKDGQQLDMLLPFPMPYLMRMEDAVVSYVADFGAKMSFAEDASFDADYGNVENVVGENGNFTIASGVASYQLKPTQTLSAGANLALNGVDTAVITGKFYKAARADGTEPQKEPSATKMVTFVPASSVYFDDSFNDAQNPTTLTVGDGSGYNSGVAAKTTAPDFTATVDFTFTGTGIDVYCTTDKAGQYVRAVVMKDGKVFENNGVRQDVQMKNYSETTRYNVPTVSFRDLPFDTYTLKLIAPASTNYKLDGIRVYNPVADSSYTGTAASEAQATFWNLRDALVNREGTEAVTFGDDTAVFGVLFLDDASRLDQSNLVDSYKNNSPKNEIYLDCYHEETNDQAEKPAQSISFTLTKEAADAAEAGHLWIGLSAPDDSNAANANTGVVTLKEEVGETPAKTISVTSAVDMYYPITADMIGAANVVTITNSGTTMISVTNLKVTGVEFPEEVVGQAKVFGAYTMKSLRIAANNGVDPDAVATPEPTPDPTPTPTQQPDFLSLIRQMISDFVSSLFGSIARLFGH